jgi:hypothetical protein
MNNVEVTMPDGLIHSDDGSSRSANVYPILGAGGVMSLRRVDPPPGNPWRVGDTLEITWGDGAPQAGKAMEVNDDGTLTAAIFTDGDLTLVMRFDGTEQP